MTSLNSLALRAAKSYREKPSGTAFGKEIIGLCMGSMTRLASLKW
jgi:hypothetical protein